MTGPTRMEQDRETYRLVNPIALRNCVLRVQDLLFPIIDLSFLRLVVVNTHPWPSPEIDGQKSVSVTLQLDRDTLEAEVSLVTTGNGWYRLSFEKLLPSHRAQLRAFLSPKKVGESIIEKLKSPEMKLFHGLNECELLTTSQGTMLFTHLDEATPGMQFLVRCISQSAILLSGHISRQDYISLANLEADPPLIQLSERDNVRKLSVCRDIITNFRPVGEADYSLKQQLLKILSEHLYSTSHRVEVPLPRPVRTVTS